MFLDGIFSSLKMISFAVFFCLVGHCSFTESLCLVIVPNGLIDGDLRVWIVSRCIFSFLKMFVSGKQPFRASKVYRRANTQMRKREIVLKTI